MENKLNGFEAYQYYLALRLHFTQESFDAFKYHFKVKADVASFIKRKDRLFFDKIATHKDPRNFLLANMIKNKKTYIREIAYGEEAQRVYKNWLKRKESQSYIFKEDLSKLKEDFNKNFICKDGQHPYLLKQYMGERITLETLCILCDLTGCLRYWHKQLIGDPVFEDLYILIIKYAPFIEYDRKKLIAIIRNNQ